MDHSVLEEFSPEQKEETQLQVRHQAWSPLPEGKWSLVLLIPDFYAGHTKEKLYSQPKQNAHTQRSQPPQGKAMLW